MKIYRAIVFLVSIFFSLSFMATAQASNTPTVEEVFSEALIGTSKNKLPHYFSQISENEYAVFVHPFSIKVRINNGVVDYVSTEIKFSAGDFTKIATYEELLGSIFYSKSPKLSGDITRNDKEQERAYTITTSDRYGDKCTYHDYESRTVEKRISNGITLHMSYWGGRKAPSCDNYSRARANGYDMVDAPGKLFISMRKP